MSLGWCRAGFAVDWWLAGVVACRFSVDGFGFPWVL